LDTLLDEHGARWHVVGPCLGGGWYAWPRGDDNAPRAVAGSPAELGIKLKEPSGPTDRADHPVPNAALRAWREEAGLSRAAMAIALNQTSSALQEHLLCDEKRIAEWEAGHTRWPAPKYERALCELTTCDLQSLGFLPPSPASETPARAAANASPGHGAGRHHTGSSPQDQRQP
jgi:transcriptional regulator with XRE-family HTH domain